MKWILDYTPYYHAPFFVDLFAYGNPFSKVYFLDGLLLVSTSSAKRMLTTLTVRLEKQQKSVLHELHAWESLFTSPESIPFSLEKKSLQEFLKAWFMVPFYSLATKQLIYRSLKGSFAERYLTYKVLTTPKTLSPKEEEQLSLYKIALLIEKNKTIKKAFTSAPLKIKEKLQTFYINIYNKILAHEKHFKWLYISPLASKPYDDLTIIRSLKRIIKEENVRRRVQELQERKKKLQLALGTLKRKKQLTKKLLYLHEVMTLLGTLQHERTYFFYRWFSVHQQKIHQHLLAKQTTFQEMLHYPYRTFIGQQKGRGKIARGYVLKKHHWEALPLKKQAFQHYFKDVVIPFFFANFSEKREGKVTVSQKNGKEKIVVLASLEKPSEALLEGTIGALVIDEGILPFTPLFALLNQLPLVLETQWLHYFVHENDTLIIDPKKETICLKKS